MSLRVDAAVPNKTVPRYYAKHISNTHDFLHRPLNAEKRTGPLVDSLHSDG